MDKCIKVIGAKENNLKEYKCINSTWNINMQLQEFQVLEKVL